ncbi:MAG: GNAT family N-acetyltransferase [Pseudonocardiaceae bacterium]
MAFPDAPESQVPGAYHGTRCAGFLRFVIQVPGAEASGADPQLRRRGTGTALRQHAAQHCRIAGCTRCDPAARLQAPGTMPSRPPPGTSCTPATKTTPATSSSACNQPRGMPHVAWPGRPMTPRNILICRDDVAASRG